ncbi:MAG: hypothetical protein ACI92E_001078 [Oceanicoccus sp.]|jgi:hypothetical protein
MTKALLHLNDLNLCWHPEGSLPTREVGVAHCGSNGIVYGNDAWGKLWMEPQHCYTQYWQQFGQSALLPPIPGVRHHADLVFHQLQQLQSESGTVEQLLVAPPSHFGNDDLQLLLAIGQSLNLPICGFIDPSVASVASSGRLLSRQVKKSLYVDMQLHQTLVVEVHRRGGQWVKGASITLSDCGLIQILNTAAHYLADVCVSEHRIDPLKIASTAQTLYTSIYNQLLFSETDFPIEFEAGNNRLTCTVTGNFWQNMLRERLTTLFNAVNAGADEDSVVILPHNSRWLTHILDLTQPVHVVKDEDVSTHLFRNWSGIVSGELLHIDALDESFSETQPTNVAQRGIADLSLAPLASHVLVNDIAYSLQSGVWINGEDNGLKVSCQPIENALLEISLSQRVLKVHWRNEAKAISAKIGETFMLYNQRLTFINVLPAQIMDDNTQAQPISSDQ